MSQYKEIKGKTVQYIGTDPSDTGAEGQVWYNSTAGAFKSVLVNKAWSSGGSMGTARYGLGFLGTQTAALGAGGYIFPGGNQNATEEYSGYSWSSGGSLGTTRRALGGAGTQTAGLVFGGITTTSVTATEEYDGSAWTAGGSLNSARSYIAGCGTQTSALGFGPSATEEYDGSTWTSSNTLNTTRQQLGGAGIQTAAVGFGGFIPGGPVVAFSYTEEYDGTNWSSVNNMNTARWALAGAGIQTSALGFGGVTPALTGATEEYDGTNWTNSPASLATARRNPGGAGSKSAALAFSGLTTTQVAVTEEYNSNVNVITKSAWASGGNLPSGKRVMGVTNSSIDASALFGGDNVPMGAGIPQLSSTEEYNGTSWTAGGPIGVNISRIAGAGTQTAALGSTGYSFPTPISTAGASYVANSWEYDGSTWTGITAHPTTRDNAGGVGSQTAGIIMAGAAGGSPGPAAAQPSVTAAEWNGSSWTVTNSINTTRRGFATGGTSPTIAWIHGGAGFPGSPGNKASIETYDGTSWTLGGNTPVGISYPSGFGTQTLAVVSSGIEGSFPAGTNTKSYQYDGTAWTSTASLATGRYGAGGDGSVGSATGFIAGGASAYSTNTTATEEFTVETSALNIKTLTTS